jgi:hypothetical protein
VTDPKHVFISYRRDQGTNQQWAERIDARLNERGFAVWRDVEGIQPGERWAFKIPPALEQSALVLCIVSESLLQSEWVDDELNFARNLNLLIVPVRIEPEYRPPFSLSGVQQLDLYTDDPTVWDKLFNLVDRHTSRVKNDSFNLITDPVGAARRRELEYLDRLLYSRYQVAQLAPIYTALAGVEQRVKNLARALPADLVPASFLHQTVAMRNSGEGQRYDDILNLFASYRDHAPRLVLLGKPGAGKSFSLRRLAAQRALAAREDPAAPIPLLVELGDWIEDELPFELFLRASLKPLAADLDELISSGRAYLLLDALNEIPTAQQSVKTAHIKDWVNQRQLAGFIVSCRERDFSAHLQLNIDTVTIKPLDSARVYQFIQRYLKIIDPANAKSRGEALFWRLAAGRSTTCDQIGYAKLIWQQLQDQGIDEFDQFWHCAAGLPLDDLNRGMLDRVIHEIERDRSNLLKLAETPYLLNILLGLFLQDELPEQTESRATVFARFVNDSLLRERKRFQKYMGETDPPGEAGLRTALAELAWNLQRASHENQQTSAQTRLPQSSHQISLNEAQLNHAVSANLLQVHSQQVNFTHQLLQEYFASLGLKRQIDNKQLPTGELWRQDSWWEPTGWEETVITIAFSFADNMNPLIEWLGDANPKLLAESLVFNGILLGDDSL